MESFDYDMTPGAGAVPSIHSDDQGRGWGWGEDSHGRSPASMAAGYQFTIADGQVTAEQVIRGPEAHSVPLSGSESFVVGAGTVTETISSIVGTEILQFGLEPGSTSLYAITDKSFTIAQPSASLPDGGTLVYDFTVAGDAVTAETRTISHGDVSNTVAITPRSDALFAIGTGGVTESWVEGNQVKSLTFVQPGGSGSYVVAAGSTGFIAQGGSATALNVEPENRATFTFDASGSVTSAAAVKTDGSIVALNPTSHISFTQLDTGFVEESISWGNHSRYVVFYDGAGHGTYTEVAHGGGSVVDLVGLKAQLAELPSALATLV